MGSWAGRPERRALPVAPTLPPSGRCALRGVTTPTFSAVLASWSRNCGSHRRGESRSRVAIAVMVVAGGVLFGPG